MMRQSGRSRWIGGLAIAALVMGAGEGAIAQIIPDNTLGTQVFGVCTGTGGTCGITGGTQRGGNLFHSFQQFSLPNGDVAGFIVAPNVQNAIVRVTGQGSGFVSNINGAIATLNQTNAGFPLSQPVNFFLMNPNGIVFGANARLFIGGSFLATTADRMVFQDGTVFSTHDPVPLLTISVPTGLQFGQPPGEIRMQSSNLSSGDTDSFSDFALIGGKVSLEGATLTDPGQRVELGGLVQSGVVGLTLSGNSLSLSFPEGMERADVSLGSDIANDVSTIDVSADNGGSIAINARNLNISDETYLQAGIAEGPGSFNSQAGDITLNATGDITIKGSSLVENRVIGFLGNGGNINITAKSLSLSDAGELSTSIFGQGNAGNININVEGLVSLVGSDPRLGPTTGIFSTVQAGAIGNSGKININAGSLSLTDGASILSIVRRASNGQLSGQGNSGDINIAIRETANLSGTFTRIASAIDGGATGKAGNITIEANTLSLADGAAIRSSLDSGAIGQAGDIAVKIQSLFMSTGATFNTFTSGQGNAGEVFVNATDTVFLSEDAFITSGVARGGIGNGGNLRIDARRLFLFSGAQLLTNIEDAFEGLPAGQGNAGNVNINVRDNVVFDGVSQDGFPSGIISTVNPGAVGRGGDINIQAKSFLLSNSASVNSGTSGQGDAGNITLTANLMEVTDGGQILASTASGNNAGNITLRVADRITLVGEDSGIFANTISGSTGNGGNIYIDPKILTIDTGARIAVNSQGSGQGGSIQIQTERLMLDNRGVISAETASNQGGNITLQLQDLLLMRRGSLISTNAGTAQAGGNSGNITINAPKGFLVTAPNENNDITANAFNGSGGRVTINAQGIYWFTPRSRTDLQRFLNTADPAKLDPRSLPTNDITAISQGSPTLNGTITITTPDLDPNRGLVALPVNLVDASRQIAQDCKPGNQSASSFVSTGRGGLPPSPTEMLQAEGVTAEWVTVAGDRGDGGDREDAETRRREDAGSSQFSIISSELDSVTQNSKLRTQNSPFPPPIIEAQGWIVDANGDIDLVSGIPAVNGQFSDSAAVNCPTP